MMIENDSLFTIIKYLLVVDKKMNKLNNFEKKTIFLVNVAIYDIPMSYPRIAITPQSSCTFFN